MGVLEIVRSFTFAKGEKDREAVYAAQERREKEANKGK